MIPGMTVHRTVERIGESLAVLIPRDVAEMMNIAEGSPVRMTLVGRQLVVEPEEDTMTEADFQRAYAAVLRRESRAFQALADYDAGKRSRRGR
jgi:antitoxin component of MazEF toxin-antitoxin module